MQHLTTTFKENKMKMSTERDLEAYGKKQLQGIGCLVYKFSSPAKRGVPDSIVILPDGAVVFIEYKHPNGQGKLSKLQEIEIKKIRAKGCYVAIVDSKAQVDLWVEYAREVALKVYNDA